MSGIVKKQKEAGAEASSTFKKKMNILDSEGEEDEEQVDTASYFTASVQEDLLSFHEKVITSAIPNELKVPDEDS